MGTKRRKRQKQQLKKRALDVENLSDKEVERQFNLLVKKGRVKTLDIPSEKWFQWKNIFTWKFLYIYAEVILALMIIALTAYITYVNRQRQAIIKETLEQTTNDQPKMVGDELAGDLGLLAATIPPPVLKNYLAESEDLDPDEFIFD